MPDFKLVAQTGDRFADFAPYVACIDDRGVVAFQATLAGGATGVFAGDGGEIIAVVADAGLHVRSHPDLRDERASFYAQRSEGGRAVMRVEGGLVAIVAEAGGELADVGPLGPTMNAAGAIAFRATTADGRAGVYLAGDETLCPIARAGQRLRGFEGLPVVTDPGAVVYRAEAHDRSQVIELWRGGRAEPVVRTGARFAELGRFPAANVAGVVAFCATSAGGGGGVFTATDGRVEAVVEEGFESYRGALIDDAGGLVFYATPPGGGLGVYRLPPGRPSTAGGAAPVRLFGIGDDRFGAAVTGFALNPVSMNAVGQLAVRVELADGRQLIVRVDPNA